MRMRFQLGLLALITVLVAGIWVSGWLPCSALGARYRWVTTRIAGWHQVRAQTIRTGEGDSLCVYSFTIKPEDPPIHNGVRAEFEVRKRWSNGERTQHIFSSRFGPGALQLPSGVTTQWHETVAKGLPNFRPPLAHRLRGGRLVVSLWNDQIHSREGSHGEGQVLATIERLDPSTWYDFKYDIHWLPTEGGSVRAWKRECLVAPNCSVEWVPWFQYQGPIGYNSALDYYLKFGAYTTRPFDESAEITHYF